ncbi:hypothetical protein GlitD10_0517 [Gloeomargarita lithophora Alchichica-D10]|uniref:Polyketide cyclase / dehydrase and lipid transport n=1 Tax=Gloeomargarita lithophora Alchichica-D10 TaxID=1188229 RepID=A0A1J0AA95_9CYAN|nr:SRPBCC family protein [Gloeomargarita lithophora]APB32829.1 hypothetical protein GlitD10_0517 [Gloeomargarita lithophora Alchichica-D10]
MTRLSDPCVLDFDVRQFTDAPLQMAGEFIFNASPEVVFDRVASPEGIVSWFPTLYAATGEHSASENGDTWGAGSKRYCNTRLMGTLNETILYWHPPQAYAYSVKNWAMPIKDHCGVMIVEPWGAHQTRFIWHQYYTPVGLFLRYLFPAMMIYMMNQGLEQLRQTLGGTGGQMRKVS